MQLHLICNAHIDPVWLWGLEDGREAALATFRSAARLCERYDYVFCHNEALLYEWIEEDDPALFQRIRTLVDEGRWHIAGGWYLQPDCNMPSGETLIRLIEHGRRYFDKAFGARPTVAMNLDPFGHSVGLVQILCKSGYMGYLICRPHTEPDVPFNRFTWVGPDGSEVDVTRVPSHYNSPLGGAEGKIRRVLEHTDESADVVLWGVGNHGGGPSARDLENIRAMMRAQAERHDIRHSTPEAFFAAAGPGAYRRHTSLNPCMPGCYSAMASVKRAFRRMENDFFATEAICAHAAALGRVDYPEGQLEEAERDLMLMSFHDVLPGSGVDEIERDALAVAAHGSELLRRAHRHAFHALLRDFEGAADGEYLAFVYNPHPRTLRSVLQADFTMADQNRSGSVTCFDVLDGDAPVPAQVIKEPANLKIDWVKRVVFDAELPPGQMRRFRLKPRLEPSAPCPAALTGGTYTFANESVCARINLQTGLIDRFASGGRELLNENACALLVYRDNDDPWAMSEEQYYEVGRYIGAFKLMSADDSARFAGNASGMLPPVRIVEDGPVLVRLEASFAFGDSAALTHYTFYRNHPYFDVHIRLDNREKNAVVRLALPSAGQGELITSGPYCFETVPANGQERPMQRWAALTDGESALVLLNNATYSIRAKGELLEAALLRSAVYAAHPEIDVTPQETGRFLPHLDQGAVYASFRVYGGPAPEALDAAENEAAAFNCHPRTLCAFPDGTGKADPALVRLEGGSGVTVTSVRRRGNRWTVRLLNNTAHSAEGVLDSPLYEVKTPVSLAPHEIQTYSLDRGGFDFEPELC